VTPDRRFPWRVYIVLGVLLLVLTLLPLLSVLFASAVASAHGCALDEGSIHPCLVMGSDWGEALYGFGVLGWLMLVTLPLGGSALLVWLLILLIHRWVWRRQQGTP
jgi:hypothetical protein